ncbi:MULTISPECIES: aminopeptidase [Marinobacter]|uniref:Zinc protease n=1 Tax=Marinobacter profundi TaxID=2666256 RepID=A0A2G1UI69_9GAMM|nr:MULTISPECIES: aminopeptidase [Marinobacter]MBD3658108.1 aminopeptidase [Marinobacter sp.]PHQ14120.1 zinc protease [Marinobacter profundi]
MKQLSQICLLLLLILPSGCATVSYYSQAAGGQLSLMMAARPVAAVLADPATAPDLRAKLQLAMTARTFAATTLALPVGDTFLDYSGFERRYVVVNLVAVPEFSLEPHRWCYPIVGCQAYRGYFDPDAAREERQRFADQGYDTFIGGVTAYSTLGWFDDPLHTGFTRLEDDRMVSLMFHELAHRVVYIEQDTAFNESFATAVELEGLRRWLTQRDDPGSFEQALARLEQRNQTLALVEATAADLHQLYRHQDELAPTELRTRKAAIFDELRADYLELAENWQQPGPFGSAPAALNNANIALFRQYNQFVPGFRQLLRDHGGDFAGFYRAVAELGRLPEATRTARLRDLGQRFDEHL